MQIKVASEYIMAVELYQDRIDFAPFISFLDHYKSLYGYYPKRIIISFVLIIKWVYTKNILCIQKKKYKNNEFNKIKSQVIIRNILMYLAFMLFETTNKIIYLLRNYQFFRIQSFECNVSIYYRE